MASAIDVPQKMSYVNKFSACKDKFCPVFLQFVDNACQKLIASNKPGEVQKLWKPVFIDLKFAGKRWFASEKSDDGKDSLYCTMTEILYGPLVSGAKSDADRDFKAWGKDGLFYEIQREIYNKYGFILLDHSDFDHAGFCMRVYSRPPSKGIMPMQPHKHDIIPRDIMDAVQAKYYHDSEVAPSTPVRVRPVREAPDAPSKPTFTHDEVAVAAPAPAPQVMAPMMPPPAMAPMMPPPAMAPMMPPPAMAPMMPPPAMAMMMPPQAMATMMPGMGYVQTAYGLMPVHHAAALAYGMHAMGMFQFPGQMQPQ